MKKFINILLLTGVLVPAVWGVATGKPASAVLLANYMRYQVAQNVMSQAVGLAEKEDAAIKDEVRQEAAWWLTGRNKVIKGELEEAFGDAASETFQKFWIEYEKAEAAGDQAYLARVLGEAGLTASDYSALRKTILDNDLGEDVSSSGALLGAIERWIKAVKDGELAPGSLKGWLNGEVTLENLPKKSALESAEAEAAPFVADAEEEDVNPLDDLRTLRAEKRKKALEDATAGMQQVATERAAAEAEYAAKKQSDATVEAANLKNHADRLNEAEKEAFEQRQKSFGNRLKNVVSATIGAATGAFTGGLGARAGQEAVEAIWGSSTPAYVQPLPPGGAVPLQGQPPPPRP